MTKEELGKLLNERFGEMYQAVTGGDLSKALSIFNDVINLVEASHEQRAVDVLKEVKKQPSKVSQLISEKEAAVVELEASVVNVKKELKK